MSVAYMMNTKQSTNKLVAEFLEWLKWMKSKWNVLLLKLEHSTIIVRNITA